MQETGFAMMDEAKHDIEHKKTKQVVRFVGL